MPLCGFNPLMLKGLTMFAQGLYAQALDRSKRDKITVERAFEIEVKEMTIFLSKLDEKYYSELRPNHNVQEAMEQLVEWVAFEPAG